MILLLLGLVLWAAAHAWKRLLPDSRARFGERGKLFVALASVLAVVLMVLGYRGWDGTVFWGKSAAMTGINNLLMLVALYIYACGATPPGRPRTWVGTKLRHPQLIGFSIWAVAHLLVNGDSPSFLLFGGLLVWALATMALINRQAPAWTPPAWGGPKTEIRVAVIFAVVFAIIAGVHSWLGYNPFGG